MSAALEGKIALVLPGDRVAINRGAYNGVARGMTFRVLATGHPMTILDPDTQEVLGVIEQEIGRGTVDELQDLLAVLLVRFTGTTRPSLRAGQVVRRVSA